MNRTRGPRLAALVASGALIWLPVQIVRAQDSKPPAGAQDKPAAPPAQDTKAPPADQSLSGPWHFNADLSSDISQLSAPQSDSSGSGSQGGRTGGYGGRGGSMGGRGGYGRGGYGGSGGGYQPSAANQQDVDTLRREVMRYTDRLDIVEHENDLVLTFSDGVVRKFPLTGKDEEVSLGATTVKSRASRDGTSIVQELQAGPLKIKRTFQTALGGQLLVVSVKADNSGAGRPGSLVPAFKFIYQRPADWTAR
jgi:hypothetical protein